MYYVWETGCNTSNTKVWTAIGPLNPPAVGSPAITHKLPKIYWKILFRVIRKSIIYFWSTVLDH